jgi:hypothetical protein
MKQAVGQDGVEEETAGQVGHLPPRRTGLPGNAMAFPGGFSRYPGIGEIFSEDCVVRQQQKAVRVAVAAIALCFSLAGHAAESNAGPAAAAVYAPAKGSADRKAILDVLRAQAKSMSGLKVVFVVTHLKVGAGWAWVEAEPQSADGSQHYETMAGLLHRDRGRWRFVEGPPEWPVCEEDPDCADPARYFRALARKHPGLPEGLFPAP